jgi:hypothetical protein
MRKSGTLAVVPILTLLPLTNAPSLLTDARYLHEKFTVLKTAGAPTALLETLVADKRVTTTGSTAPPSSPRPTTPTPPSPLPLPPSNVPLGGAARPGGAMLTKRPSLFSNERFKGMLSRSNTAPYAPAPIPVGSCTPRKAGRIQAGRRRRAAFAFEWRRDAECES